MGRELLDGVRVRRLSGAATRILAALDAEGAQLSFDAHGGAAQGMYRLQRTVVGKTVDVLLNARLIRRVPAAITPTYSISDAGRDFLQRLVRDSED